jgi:IMP dehydrogenase
VRQTLAYCKNTYPNLPILAGNIATGDGALALVDWGADAVRVGIGGGSLCETRIRTGVGIPMVTCLMEVLEAVPDTPIIADGGMKNPGDMCKALAAGADAVMLGSVLAGSKESPGEVISVVTEWPYETKYKRYRGSASAEAKAARGEPTDFVEGNGTLIPYKGKVKRILVDIENGMKSSFSYVGARTMDEFHRNAELVQITNAGVIEAKPHLLLR